MKIKKFGTITEKDGILSVDGFDFSGSGDMLDALIAIKKRFSDEVDKVLAMHSDKYRDIADDVNRPDQMMKLNAIMQTVKQANN
tara:strand:- start:445 stop:696 length:252 start_codon:yes stop_codon:yes gene_type:complete